MKILLNSEKNKYRANLHCHSNMSDGKKTPAELKEFYKSHGYSVLAITDHDLFVPHNDLTDEDFLMLNGFEFEINEERDVDFSNIKCCHLCYVALDKDIDTSICYHREWYLFGNAPKYRDLLKFDPNEPDYVRHYTAESINDMIKRGRDANFFVTYNHPVWSCESYPEYSKYEGMNAMEMTNYGCVAAGYEDYNGQVYRDMLEDGKKIYCICADDNHNHRDDNGPDCDSFGGYIMIDSHKLDYPSIAQALKDGNFYAVSATCFDNGPEIFSLTYDNDSSEIEIKCSDVKQIALLTSSRRNSAVNADRDQTISEAKFKLAENENWFRLVIRDEKGNKAYTNAYFLDDLK